MKKTNMWRFIILCVVLLAMMGALISQLGSLTLAEGETLSEQASDRVLRTIAVKGTRGRILDRNGIVLAYSKTSYNVEFFRDADKRTDYDSAVYTEALIKAIEIVEAGGGQTIDTSYIRMDENGELYFDWGVESDGAIKARYKNYCAAMGFTIKDDLEKPREEWDLSKWPTAEYCYVRLRKWWYIPEEMPFEEAVKIISIRQEVILNNYRAYEPVTIAYDVSLDVVAEINMHSEELVGLQTSQSTTRIYPRGTTAAHLVGYLSRSATADMVEEYGYSYEDFIGATGVEATMEEHLTGATYAQQGERVVEVNKNGSIIREISATPAKDGNDVMLTIDVQLQTVVEQALESLISRIKATQEAQIEAHKEDDYKDAYGGDLSKIKTAATGAIVVMDVTNGNVLSMASYPSYDPNWFIAGLTEAQSEQLFSSDEAAATTPTRNKAISAKLAPGSIFKMVTGIAGVTEGVIGLDERVDDKSPYIIVDDSGREIRTGAPSCWTKRTSKHAQQNLSLAITNSCNYYFCEVAYRLGIDTLNEWSGRFGLTEKTNIELTGEATGIVGGQAVLFDNELYDENGDLSIALQKTSLPGLIYRKLCEKLTGYVASRTGGEVDEDAIKVCALHLMRLQDGSMEGKGPQIRQLLANELSIPEGVTLVQPWVNEITSLLNEIQWKATQTIRAGFGQGVSLVTPVAVARYISAVANNGTVYDAHVISRIVDQNGVTVEQIEPTVFESLDDVPDEVWTAVKRGMEGVISPEDEGTAAKEFTEEFIEKYQDYLCGKTGTAQVGTSTIDIENTSWFVTFTPRENAEIAIVICVPNGYSGASSVSAAEEILTYYFEKKDSAAPENLVDIYAVAP